MATMDWIVRVALSTVIVQCFARGSRVMLISTMPQFAARWGPVNPTLAHCHPVERGGVYWKWRNMSRLHNKNDVIDFDFVWVFFAARPVPNWPNARRKADILSNHGLDSWRTISPLRQPLPGQLSDS